MIGSFLNVCIYRLPREESIVTPGSHCPQCQRPIRFYDNIPLASYLILSGKCRHCDAPISPQYPFVEGVTALSSLCLFAKFGPSWSYLFYFAFIAALIAITVIDFYHQIIPDVISLPGIGVGLLASFFLPQITFFDSLLGVLLGGGSLFLVATGYHWLFKREGMGGGDVKLLAMIGAFLGVEALPLVIVISAGLGTLTGLILVLGQAPGQRHCWRSISLPYGPFLAAGAWCYLFWGERLLNLLSGGG